MIYYAKSKNAQGEQETLQQHLKRVRKLALKYGEPLGLGAAAALAGLIHDFGKYTLVFQEVLKGLRTGIDHALGGASFLECYYRGAAGSRPVIEAVNGHHDGLVAYDMIRADLHAVADPNAKVRGNGGKTPSIESREQLLAAVAALRADFPDFQPPRRLPSPPAAQLESMLYTRMVFSCLVDADYTASAETNDKTSLKHAQNDSFDPKLLLENLYAHRNRIKQDSTADPSLNQYRDQIFGQCGTMGKEPAGLFTLTAPTGTGKTLAMLHFALQHCIEHGKQRIIVVLPFLTLAEQSAQTYAEIIPNVLIDHSQSGLPEEARELAARWSAPFIITTSVRFFESLFSDRPTDCRKLHNIANSVVLFDEAQSLPADLMSATLRAVNELCSQYHTTVVFSTATQPDFSMITGSNPIPREILPENSKLFHALQRVKVQWRLNAATPLQDIAEEMSRSDSVCAIVNLRRHARKVFNRLSQLCPADTVFFLTTDLCPAHRSRQIEIIRRRLYQKLPCRVVSTQCIEAGVDLDFQTMYRALAPLESIIQAAGRCNRNGGDPPGQLIVFIPEDKQGLYPDRRYQKAADIVLEMQPPVSIDDPDTIREYYRRLWENTPSNADLQTAIASRSFEQAAKHYKLIADTGLRIIVPYGGEAEKYRKAAAQAREHGLTRALLKETAPITVTCFAKNIETYAEELPFANQKRSRSADSAAGSKIYLLRPEYESLYSAQTGLCFPQE